MQITAEVLDFDLIVFIEKSFFFTGEFLASRRRYKEAAVMYEKAAELRSGDHELAVAAATAMRQAGRHEEAEHWYRTAVDLKPSVSISST